MVTAPGRVSPRSVSFSIFVSFKYVAPINLTYPSYNICGDGARSSFTELHFVPPPHFTPVLESKKYFADLEQLFTTIVDIFSIGGDDAFPNTFPFYTFIYKLMGSERCDPSDIFVNLISITFWMRIVNSSTIMQFTFLQHLRKC